MNSNNISREAVDQLIERWGEISKDIDDEGPKMPIAVLLGEAIDLAELVDVYMQPREVAGKRIPGLISVVGRGEFQAGISNELRELQVACSAVNARYTTFLQQYSAVTPEQASDIISELRASLSFLLEDDNHLAGEDQLARLREQEQKGHTHDELALVLEGYAELSNQYLEELRSLDDFDETILKEALQVANGLRMRSANALTGQAASEQRALLSLRNRLLNALGSRIKEIRRAVRYVFRHHPEIVRKATSEYSRDAKRRSARRARDSSSTDNAPISAVENTEPTLERQKASN